MKRSHSYARAWIAAGALSIVGLANLPDPPGRDAEGTDHRKAHVVASGPKSPQTHASKQPARPRTARTVRPARSRLPPAARGTLRRGDATLQSGEYVDRIRVRFSAGEPVQIRLASRAFDPYVIVRSPSGVELQNDDLSSSTRDAGVDVAAAEDGAYTILITSYQPGETGAYTLRYTTGEPPADVGGGAVAATDTTPSTPTPNPPAPNMPSGSTAAQSTEAGELATGDRQLRTGELYDTFERVVPAGQALRVRLESTEFDPYLMVRSPSGRQLDNDDTTPQDRNATVEVPVSEAGTYTITVTSYQPGEHGHYRLLASGGAAAASRPTTPTTPNTTPTPTNSGHIAAAANGGHVYGIFGGISDYPGSSNDLDDCAEDAVKLAQALRRANLMTEAQQILLTNAQMTPAAVRDAMTRMATMVGPSDIFIFFYSGHGGRNEGSSDVREIDRIDETIFLYDGEIVDDEMGQLFDGIHGRLALLALDSCYAGGFAKDVITQPGRVGFFSSEEDVESAVASEFQAGGYLSYFLREGTAGNADASPRDSVLTVGELEHYLIGQFAQHATNVAMEGAFQHLVVDRGAVRSDQPLWQFR